MSEFVWRDIVLKTEKTKNSWKGMSKIQGVDITNEGHGIFIARLQSTGESMILDPYPWVISWLSSRDLPYRDTFNKIIVEHVDLRCCSFSNDWWNVTYSIRSDDPLVSISKTLVHIHGKRKDMEELTEGSTPFVVTSRLASSVMAVILKSSHLEAFMKTPHWININVSSKWIIKYNDLSMDPEDNRQSILMSGPLFTKMIDNFKKGKDRELNLLMASMIT